MAGQGPRGSESGNLEDSLERLLGGAADRRVSPRAPVGLADALSATLIPVEPSQQFVRELGRGLSMAASRSRQSLVRRYRTAIVIGAAVFGSLASVVGVAVLITRQRSRMRAGLSQ